MGIVRNLRLVPVSADETVRTFLHLADLASKGKLKGSAICVSDQNGDELVYFTDCYRANTSLAAGAAMRISMQLMQALDPPL